MHIAASARMMARNIYSVPISFQAAISSLAGTGAKVGQFPVISLKGNTYTHPVKNGSFESDMSDWANVGISATAPQVVTTQKYYGQKALKLVANIDKPRVNQPINIIAGHKYYISVMRFVESGSIGSSGVYIADNEGLTAYYTLPETNTTLNTWVQHKGIYTATTTHIEYFQIGRGSSQTYVSYFDGFMLIDLTALGIDTLTVDQCNQRFPYWFDATKSTFSSKLFTAKNIFGGVRAADKIVATINDAVRAIKTVVDGRYCIALTGGSTVLNKVVYDKFEPNTQYTIQFYGRRSQSYACVGFKVVYTDGSSFVINAQSTSWALTSYVTTVGKSVANISLLNQNGNTDYFDYDTLQVEKGAIATSVDQSYSEAYTPADMVLRSVGSVKDEFSIVDGVETQRNKRIISDGSSGWVKSGTYSTQSNIDVFYITIVDGAKSNNTLQPATIDGYRYLGNNPALFTNDSSISSKEYAIADVNSGTQLGIYIATAKGQTPANTLASNPIALIYQLLVPTSEQKPVRIFRNGKYTRAIECDGESTTIMQESIISAETQPNETNQIQLPMTLPDGSTAVITGLDCCYKFTGYDWVDVKADTSLNTSTGVVTINGADISKTYFVVATINPVGTLAEISLTHPV